MLQFKDAKFVTSAVKANQFPALKNTKGNPLAEVAVIGRSNVGKSSLLNHLFRRKNLVKTSSTPGKTRLLNFFLVDEDLVFVDLPGYGYAQVPDQVKQQWGPMIQEYFSNRPELVLSLFLFDIRRVPNEEDLGLFQWLAELGKPIILILTKADKIAKTKRISTIKKILQSFHRDDFPWIPYSTIDNLGRLELIKGIQAALKEVYGTS